MTAIHTQIDVNATYSDVKAVKTFCARLPSAPDYREVLNNVLVGSNNFDVDNVRFIRADDIDEILAEELEVDAYVLGCFNADFIAINTAFPVALVEAVQKAEAFETLGEAIIESADMIEFAKAYADADGYGAHFNHYDGNEETENLCGTVFYIFDNH